MKDIIRGALVLIAAFALLGVLFAKLKTRAEDHRTKIELSYEE